MGTFEIHGNSERRVNYDIAVIDICFTDSGDTSFLASKHVMQECEKFLEELEKEGVNPTSLSLEDDTIEESRYRDDDSFSAERTLELRIPFKMELINRIRQILDEKEYSATFDLNYELSNESEIHDELLKEALLDSKAKAELLADSLGMKVKGIESVETYGRSSGRMDWCECEQERSMDYMAAPQFLRSNKLQAKEEKISETIEVKWIIE